jgi:lipopolysaccharide heptosyltransferase II
MAELPDLKRILIINTYGVGDVLFTIPVIKNLRQAYPGVHIAYLANRRNEDFLKVNSDIDKVFVYERDEFVAVYRQNPLTFYRKWLELFKSIKKEGYDLVLDWSLNSTFGLLCAASGIRRRVGFDYKKRGRFLTDPIAFIGYEDKHIVEYNLDLLRHLKIPVDIKQMAFTIPAQDRQWARDWLRENKVDSSKPLIAAVVGGGASWGKDARYRRWDASKYADLLDKIIEKFDAGIILMGDSKEEALCRQVADQAHFPIHFAVGKTTLSRMAALFAECRLAICNDAGPLHVAVAVGLKTVSIFGPVDPLIYGPYPAKGHVVVQKGLPCQPCYRRFRMAQCAHISCLNELSVEEVFRKVESIL